MKRAINAAWANEVMDKIRMIRNLCKNGTGEEMIRMELKNCGAESEDQLIAIIAGETPAFELSDLIESEKEAALMEVFETTLAEQGEEFVPKEEVQEVIKQIVPQDPIHKEAAKMKKHGKKDKEKNVQWLGGVQLQPKTDKVWGTILYPILDGDGAVIGLHRNEDGSKTEGWIEVSAVSSFRNLPVEFVTIANTDTAIKAQTLCYYQRVLNIRDRKLNKSEEEWRIVVGNLKKSDCILGVMTKKEWDAFFGCDVRMLNLWKVILPCMTPTTIKLREDMSTIKVMRYRIIDAMVTDEGYPQHDGDVPQPVRAEFYKHADLQKDKDNNLILDNKGQAIPKDGAKAKKINRNWQLRITDGTDIYGNTLPKIKAKAYADYEQYKRLMDRFGFPIDAQDGVLTMDNVKTLKHLYKHGDILHVPVERIRNIKTKMKKWSSSFGGQIMASSNHKLTRLIFRQHGIVQRAETIKGAAELKLKDVISVLKSDDKGTWDDAVSFPAKMAFSRYINGEWYVPRMYRDTFYTRLEAYYRENGIKLQISSDGYYLQGDDRLDQMERDFSAQYSGKLQYFVILPNTAAFKEGSADHVKVGDSIILGRDPMAGASNAMTFIVAGFSDSLDNVLLSWKALYSMYADVDGDSHKYEAQVANSTNEVYECIARPAPGLKAPKPAPESLPRLAAYIEEHIAVGMLVLKSAADTGSLDLLVRQIMEERLEAGMPLSITENMQLSELRQAAIDGMKHTDKGAEEDAADVIIREFGVEGKKKKLSESPMTYRLIRKDAGLGQGWSEIDIFLERIRLVNECVVPEDHPYIDFFNTLKGIKTIPEDSGLEDSQWLWDKCHALWLMVIEKLSAPDHAFHHSLQDVEEFGAWMAEHYRKESKRLLKLNENKKKEGFNELRVYLRSEVQMRCQELFVRGFIRVGDVCGHKWTADGKVIPFTPEELERISKNEAIQDKMARYQRHLAIYLSTRGFGRGTKQYEDSEGSVYTSIYGKTGTVLWNVLEEYSVFVAELINKECIKTGEFPEINPELEEIKKSIIRNREKAKNKDIIHAQEFIDAEID